MNIYKDLVKYNMVDAIVATGASIIDMDFFEALGFKHYQGSQFQDDTELRKNYIDRIYDTYIDEDELDALAQKRLMMHANKEGRPVFFDAATGQVLDERLVKKTRLLEMLYFRDKNVYTKVVREEAFRLTGRAPIVVSGSM